MITWENYEEYMMMHADGELQPAEEQELTAFIEAHPELKKELALFESVKLVPDTAMVYDSKKSLLKPAGGRLIAFSGWQRYSIAAGVAAILVITFFKFNGSKNDVAIINNDSPKTLVTEPKNNVALQSQNKAVQQSQSNIAEAIDTTHKSQAPANNNNIAAVIPNTNTIAKQPMIKQILKRHRRMADDQQPVASVKTQNPISKMYPSDIKEFPNNGIAAASPVVAEVPTLPVTETKNEQEQSFFDKLPIGDHKKQGLEDAATALATGFDKISSIKQEISETSISIKVQKRRLVISF